MQKRPKKMRMHIYVAVDTERYLKKMAKQYNTSMGDVVDHLVKESKNGSK